MQSFQVRLTVHSTLGAQNLASAQRLVDTLRVQLAQVDPRIWYVEVQAIESPKAHGASA